MRRLLPGDLDVPIVGAPLAGGPSTVALAAAVGSAGGLGFLASGYRSAKAVAADIEALRAGGRPFGVNVFVPGGDRADPAAVAAYAAGLAEEARRHGARIGEPRPGDDDDWDAKITLLLAERVPVASFTFGCPPARAISALQEGGTAVWVTVTTPAEAREARDAGADALVVQGAEAGGHRGGFDDAGPGVIGSLALLQLVRAAVDAPLVATGGIATGAGLAAVLAAGAQAGQIGTALLRTPEAGTADAHRRALAANAPTGLTRAFTGRTARGIVNRFQSEHPDAPNAYPEIHHLTAPIRAAARAAGDPDAINLWACEAYPLSTVTPAAVLVRRFAEDARGALRAAAARLA